MGGNEEALARYECNMKIANAFRIFKELDAAGMLDHETLDGLTIERYLDVVGTVMSRHYSTDVAEMLARWGSYTVSAPERADGWSPMIDDLVGGNC